MTDIFLSHHTVQLCSCFHKEVKQNKTKEGAEGLGDNQGGGIPVDLILLGEGRRTPRMP